MRHGRFLIHLIRTDCAAGTAGCRLGHQYLFRALQRPMAKLVPSLIQLFLCLSLPDKDHTI